MSVISKFGENEFKSGDNERGRTYFESVLENAARRVDVWSVYLDMEIKYGDEDRAKYACLFLQPLEQVRTLSANAADVCSSARQACSYHPRR